MREATWAVKWEATLAAASAALFVVRLVARSGEKLEGTLAAVSAELSVVRLVARSG
jgi:hypothetical protein